MKKLFIVIIFLIASATQAQFKESLADSIVASDSLSGAYDLQWRDLASIDMPAAFTGTSLSLLTSADTTAANFKYVYDQDGNQVTITVAASRYIILTPIKVWHLKRYIKLESDSTEAASRTITIGRSAL